MRSSPPNLLKMNIDVNIYLKHALCFSVGINNGSACLYIDFSPTILGKVGQIISYEHDPDRYIIIANNFDEYLQLLIDQDFSFLTEKFNDRSYRIITQFLL